jgi:hypothetical protein
MAAQSLTDWLQQNRLVVVSVDPATGRVRLKEEGATCTDVTCADRTVVLTEDGPTADLGALNPGDIVRLEGGREGPSQVVVVRRVWEELTSPEF